MSQVFGTIPPPLLYRYQMDTVGTARSTDSNPRTFSPLFHALYFVFNYIKPRSLIFQDLKKALWRQGLLLKHTQPFCFSCTKSVAAEQFAVFILVCPCQHMAQNSLREHGALNQETSVVPSLKNLKLILEEQLFAWRASLCSGCGQAFGEVTSSAGKQAAWTEPVPWNSLRLAQDKSPFCCFSRKDLPGETGHEWCPYTAFERYHCKKISSHVQCKLWVQFLSFALISSCC